ncbi:MAG TPA: hypothetical protein VFF18_17475 [Woeseiaceae bacterium]|nr:hypothetical protein [Woeseiaceae bacterium]
MEISNYYVPVTLILPIIAILGILFVTLAMSFVARRRRQDEGQDERAERQESGERDREKNNSGSA